MGLLTKWNKLAVKKIHINSRAEIAVGRLILGIILFSITTFTGWDLNWIFLLIGINIHRKNNDKEEKDE